MDELNAKIHDLLANLPQVGSEFATVWLPLQGGIIIVAILVAIVIARLVRRFFDAANATQRWPLPLRLIVRAFLRNLAPIVFIILAVSARAAMLQMTYPSRSYLLGGAVSLVTAWVVISLATTIIRNQFVKKLVAVSAWTIAALSILGLLAPTAAGLDSVGIAMAGIRITPLLIIKTVVLLLVALWLASLLSNLIENRVQSTADLTPSIKVLLGKLIRITLIVLAIIIVMSSVGIDLSALALFSGAIGVGLGFGLQKIVSNLISGIILLADKSIKPGDVISLGDKFGWIDRMGARYTSVVTRDGREVLVPNEDFITQRVVNWSYSDNLIRLDIPFGVSYNADPHKVRELAVEAAISVTRVLAKPEPVCHFMELGDSSLNFSLRFWIEDPNDGIVNVRGLVLLALWDVLKRENIEIPFPQRDLNMRNPLHVVLRKDVAD